MNKQKFIYLILTISVLISFTACNEAKDSIPSDVTTETTLSEQVTTIETNDIDFVSPSTEETVSSLDYTLPDDDVVTEEQEEDTSITTYTSNPDGNTSTSSDGNTSTSSDGNTTTSSDGNTSTSSDGNTTTSSDGNTTTSSDGNTTTSSDGNTTIPPEEEIIVEIKYTSGFVGKLVDSYVNGVDYTCDGETNTTDYLGRFNCETMPVTFSLGNILLGSIEKMTEDYLIFPQDLLGLNRGAALHPDVTKIAILFQSLDADANPENGIVINQNIIELLNQEQTQMVNIQDISLTQLKLDIENIIINDSTNQLQLVLSQQAEDHLLKSLSTILISPIQP